MKAKEILDKHLINKFDEVDKNTMLSAMKEYAEYIAKCAHRDLRHDLVETFYRTDLSEVDFDGIIMNHEFVAPKELLQ